MNTDLEAAATAAREQSLYLPLRQQEGGESVDMLQPEYMQDLTWAIVSGVLFAVLGLAVAWWIWENWQALAMLWGRL
jgi:hypothetical protein